MLAIMRLAIFAIVVSIAGLAFAVEPLIAQIEMRAGAPEVDFRAISAKRPQVDRLEVLGSDGLVAKKLTLQTSAGSPQDVPMENVNCPTRAAAPPSACYELRYPDATGKFTLAAEFELDGAPKSAAAPGLELLPDDSSTTKGDPAKKNGNGDPNPKEPAGCKYDPANPSDFYPCVLNKFFADQPEVISKHKDVPQNVYLRDDDRALLFYSSKGEALYPVPRVDEDDVVTIAVVPTELKPIKNVRVTSCVARPAFRIKEGGARVEGYASGATPLPVEYVTANSCSADGDIKVAILTSVEGDGATLQPNEIVVETLPLYNVILSLGLVYDFSLETEWKTRTAKGATVPQIVEDEHVVGLDEPILLVGYHWYAVDTERPRTWSDVIPAPFLGFSFTDPLSHLYFGVIVEPFPGFGAMVGWHAFKKQSVAAGYSAGDSFPSGSVPTDERWSLDARNVTLGLSIDSSVLVDVLESVRGDR